MWSEGTSGENEGLGNQLVGAKARPMEASQAKRQLILDGERTLLPFSLGLLLISLTLPASFAFGWPLIPRVASFPGLMFSPVFFVLSCWEIARYQRGWRTILAAFVSLIASLVGWGSLVLYTTGRFHCSMSDFR